MSVFGQQSHTLTEMAKQLGHSDHLLKAQYRGSAPLDHSITAESWLPGTSGAHCNVTHGDRWEEIKGAVTQHFYDKKTSTHDGEFTETYNDDATRHIYGATTENHFGHKSENYYSPNSLETWANNHVEWNNFLGVYGQHWYKSAYTHFSVTGVNLGIQVYNYKVSIIGDAGWVTIDATIKDRDFGAFAKKFWVGAYQNIVVPWQQGVAAMRNNICPLSDILGVFSNGPAFTFTDVPWG